MCDLAVCNAIEIVIEIKTMMIDDKSIIHQRKEEDTGLLRYTGLHLNQVTNKLI